MKSSVDFVQELFGSVTTDIAKSSSGLMQPLTMLLQYAKEINDISVEAPGLTSEIDELLGIYTAAEREFNSLSRRMNDLNESMAKLHFARDISETLGIMQFQWESAVRDQACNVTNAARIEMQRMIPAYGKHVVMTLREAKQIVREIVSNDEFNNHECNLILMDIIEHSLFPKEKRFLDELNQIGARAGRYTAARRAVSEMFEQGGSILLISDLAG